MEENHAFATAQEFPYPLISDTEHVTGEAYGVARPAGDKFAAFPRRRSFLIDPVGTIRRTYDVTDVAVHADEVLTDLAALAGPGTGPGSGSEPGATTP